MALYAASLDPRIQATLVSGYFQSREEVWKELIYRDIWDLLREFADAEVAGMIAPRALIVEASRFPEVPGPPASSAERRGAAPMGAITIEGFEQQKLRIDAQIAELQAMLPGEPVVTPDAPSAKRRPMSASARKRMSEAQKKRWAGSSPAPVTPEPTKPKRKLSAAGKAAIVAALKKRWAAKKAAAVPPAPVVAKKAAAKKAAPPKAAVKKPARVPVAATA